MTSTRFLTGSLATLAVASAFTLAMPSAQADSAAVPCGTPAVDAVYVTYIHEATYRTVPAVTHTEWRWERDVPTYEYEFSKVTSPARSETDWTRTLTGDTEYLFTRTVIDQRAVPAVPATDEIGHFVTVEVEPAVTEIEAEYRHEVTGKTRWESPDWGDHQDSEHMWKKTGNTRTTVLEAAVTTEKWIVDEPARPGTPAVPEVSHVESTWATSAPADFDPEPVDQRPGKTSVETTTTDGSTPAGDGWAATDERSFPAVVDLVWAQDAPAGYEPTDHARVAGSTHETSDGASAAAPAGDGWTELAGSATEVTDAPAHQELVTPGYTENVLVTPAVPAGPPCTDAPDPGGSTSVDAPSAGGGGPTSAAAAPAGATVLPDTGNGVPGWMAPVGLGAVLAGVGMVRKGRRTLQR